MLACLFIAPGGLSRAERAALSVEFPTVEIHDGVPLVPEAAVVDATAWVDPSLDFNSLDSRVASAAAEGGFGLRIAGQRGDSLSLLTRYQRFIGRRNPASACSVFDWILDAHRALHDLEKPLLRADHHHALDTWQWLLRLEPEASLALQAAALFHDIERLESEALSRVEHRSQNYQAFKDAHARRGAAIAREALAGGGLDSPVLERIGALIEGHERPQADPEGASLNEADALSFFSLNSSGFLDYYGREHTRRKVAYTLGRLGPEARRRLNSIRLRSDLSAIVHDVEES